MLVDGSPEGLTGMVDMKSTSNAGSGDSERSSSVLMLIERSPRKGSGVDDGREPDKGDRRKLGWKLS